MSQIQKMAASIVLLTAFIGAPVLAWIPPADGASKNERRIINVSESGLPADQLRQTGVHDAGRLYLTADCGAFPIYRYYFIGYDDPETGLPIDEPRFPTGSDHIVLYDNALWIGGVVEDDTLVSMGLDGWFGSLLEFWPPDPEQGGLVRTGRFADDEFVAVYTDTVTTAPYINQYYPFDENGHTPMGLKITQSSYSWRDTLYNDFVIFDFVVENIRSHPITEGWIGILFDPELYADTGDGSWIGYRDDASGLLDTLLNDADPQSRVLIAYGFDRDGDPLANSEWNENSVRSVISISLLATSIENPEINFNWWLSNGNRNFDFGPRRLGTPEDPLRLFNGSIIGTASKQEDKYYLLSHREVDYNALEMMVHDSSDGWIPATALYEEYIHDSKMLYSFGPFDLAPGDSVTFAIVISGSENFLVDPDDYTNFFDPESPYEYQARFDFNRLMTNHRRADSVYRSGFTLPRPGPPVGLKVVDYDDDYVSLTWNSSHHPAVSGYYLNVKDTSYSDLWFHAFFEPVHDTTCIFTVINPTHDHSLAISLVDDAGYESALSRDIDIIPARPHAPCSLSAVLDSLTAVLNWQPPDDLGLAVYMIYRGSWTDSLEVYDSTMQTWYRDVNTESGVKYIYRVTACHECGAESEPSNPASVLPMALDKGVLFYDLNFDNTQSVGPYNKCYVDRLFYSLQPAASPSYYDIEEGFLSFKDMADYTMIIFDSEKRGGRFPPEVIDSVANYLNHGGRALFIIPNAVETSIGSSPPRTLVYSEGNFFHDILHIDSAVVNSIVLKDNAIWGDLMGCSPIAENYPILEADTAKLVAARVDISGYIPYSGFIFPDDEVEIIYRYQSLYPDSLFHGQVNSITCTEENYRFVLFGFPLSLMSETSNIVALRQALRYLGVYMDCGDINSDNRLDIGDAVYLIEYLYRGGPPPADGRRADVNCDGQVETGDAIEIINLIFLGAAGLNCCQ